MKKANKEHTFRWVNLAVGSGGQLAIRVPGFRSHCIRLMPTLKTGLRMCPAEKRRDSDPFAAEQSVLCSPVCLGIIAKYGHLSRISEVEEPTFSAVQTAWRREVDSNPRYGFATLSLDISVSCR